LTILEHYHQEGNNSVMEMLRNNFMNQQTWNLQKFLMNFIKSETPICPDVLINLVFQVLSDGRWAPRCSSSWTFVLPSLNIRHCFHTSDSLITPSPYTAISWQ
jgi:hypothetical protein